MDYSNEKKLKEMALQDVLSELSARQGHLTGGAGLGLVTVISASLTQFIFELQQGKAKYQQQSAEIKQLIVRAKKLSDELLALTVADSKAFEPVRIAFKMPKSTPIESKQRQQALDQGYLAASQPLLSMLTKLAELVDLYEAMIALEVSGVIISDAWMCIHFIQAAARSAKHMIENNLAEVAASREVENMRCQLQSTYSELVPRAAKVENQLQMYLDHQSWQGES